MLRKRRDHDERMAFGEAMSARIYMCVYVYDYIWLFIDVLEGGR